MRFFVLLAVLAIAGSSSGLLIDLTNRCTSGFFSCALGAVAGQLGSTITNMSTQLAQAGKAVLESAVETGKSIVNQIATGTLATLSQALDKVKVGKRELSGAQFLLDLLQQAQQFLQAGGQSLKDKFVAVVSKLADAAGHFIDMKGDVATEVDSAVGQFKGDAEAFLNNLRGFLQQIGQKMALKLNELLGSNAAKRGISDILSGAASALQGALKSVVDAMSPHVNTVIKQVTDLGSTIKGQAADLIGKVKQSTEDLKGKLQTHVQTLADHGKVLIQHGKDALGATKDALSQILSQTLNNAKGTIDGVINTGKDAIGVVVDHVSGQGY